MVGQVLVAGSEARGAHDKITAGCSEKGSKVGNTKILMFEFPIFRGRWVSCTHHLHVAGISKN